MWVSDIRIKSSLCLVVNSISSCLFSVIPFAFQIAAFRDSGFLYCCVSIIAMLVGVGPGCLLKMCAWLLVMRWFR